jgi:hypothetical protein
MAGQIGLDLMDYFAYEMDTLRLPHPRAIYQRVQHSFDTLLDIQQAIQIINNLKKREFNPDYIQIIREILQRMPSTETKEREAILQLCETIFSYLDDIPIAEWKHSAS